jgi:hypothetical protein
MKINHFRISQNLDMTWIFGLGQFRKDENFENLIQICLSNTLDMN